MKIRGQICMTKNTWGVGGGWGAGTCLLHWDLSYSYSFDIYIWALWPCVTVSSYIPYYRNFSRLLTSQIYQKHKWIHHVPQTAKLPSYLAPHCPTQEILKLVLRKCKGLSISQLKSLSCLKLQGLYKSPTLSFYLENIMIIFLKIRSRGYSWVPSYT